MKLCRIAGIYCHDVLHSWLWECTYCNLVIAFHLTSAPFVADEAYNIVITFHLRLAPFVADEA